jgi:antibiotic biosynthesis monooxygenase (ABM) superfamily enzyme
MIAHLVLFRPRADLSDEAEQALTASFEAALTQIASIRRARVGKRIATGRSYEALMRVDYSYAAMIEFDDRDGLNAYLEHPSHQQLASRFFSAFEEALVYDFELHEGTAGLTALFGDPH